MLENGAAIAFLLASAEQSESDPVSTLFQQLKELMPPWLWAVLFIVAALCLFALDIGDKYSGIFGSPFQRSQPSIDQLERTRQQLLTIVKKEVSRRLATSLHNLVKLDLYMEDQRQRVGNPRVEMVPEDPEPSFQAVNRVLHTKGNKPPLDLKLTQKIIDVFERQDIAGKLLILGEPGSGKTTELLQLAQDLVTRVKRDDQHPVPVILELSSWNGEPIDKWVASQLKTLYNLSEATTQQWLAGNQILLLLDGLDELGLTKQRQCIEEINQFLETTRTSELVVCCRREEYEAGEIELDGLNGAVYLEALKQDQIRQYFEKLNRLSLWNNVRDNPALLELAQKPLFLAMLVVAYQDNPIRNEQELFDAYIEKQLHEPANQVTYKPGKGPSPKRTRHYLVWLAKQLENIRETEFLIEELQPTLLSSTKEIRLYRLLFGLSIGLVAGLTTVLTFWLAGSLLFGLLVGLSSGLLFGSSSIRSEQNNRLNWFIIEPKEQLQWSFGSGLFYGLSRGLLTGLLVSLTYGLIFGLRLEEELSSSVLIALRVGLFAGMGAGFMGVLNNSLSGVSITEKKTPNQGIQKSIQNSLLISLLTGPLYGLFNTLLNLLYEGIGNMLFSIMIGLNVAVFVGLNSGLETAIQHFILRIFLTKNGYTPWNYARFLDHAVKHRFIQRTGGRYRFVHDLLRKHFAAMPLN
ncbi:MAG: NACHT domain-containing protein [Cyanobacteria bacterium P01_F01_bin.86]